MDGAHRFDEGERPRAELCQAIHFALQTRAVTEAAPFYERGDGERGGSSDLRASQPTVRVVMISVRDMGMMHG